MTTTAELDVSIANPRIKQYLDDKVPTVPTEEILEVFSRPTKAGTFLEVLDNELTRAVIEAKNNNRRIRSEVITQQLLIITRCHVAYKEGEDPSRWVPLVARAFKTLWLLAKKIG